MSANWHICYTYGYMTFEQMLAWDHQLGLNPDGGSVFQSAEIAETKQLNHWQPLYLTINGIAVTILQKTPPYLGNFWYIPKGPGIAHSGQLADMLPELRRQAALHKVFAVKIEPELPKTTEVYQQITSLGFVHTRAIQPNSSTVLIDLRPGEHALLASLNQKARHAINRAMRDGVAAKPVIFSPTNAKIMYDLLVQTAQGRFEHSLRPLEYYYKFWETFYDTNQGSLFFAYHNGQVVSAAFAMHMGHKSTYKDGASVRDKQVYGASHLLQWEIMRYMKERGCLQHDLCGAPPSDQINNTSHPLYGIGRFKTSFNKQVTDYIGAFDLPLHKLKYWLWTKIGERFTVRAYTKRHKQSWY